ncbi:MAG: carbohydrate ABC transporter permease, partial [Bacillota bacterium]|nr:carbohydrate ABC transporter permease [Bacillota bacterium]
MKEASRSYLIFNFINIGTLTVFALLCLYPFYYMIIFSLSNPIEALKGIGFLPRGLTADNYIKVAKIETIPRAALISIFRTVVGSFLTLLCSSFFAYLVSKQQMYLRKLIYRGTVLTLYISGGLIPTFLTILFYGLNDSLFVYIIPGMITAYYVILIKTYVESIPSSLEESATIDGAGIIRCWWHIIFPLSKPISATILVFAMVSQWNAWFDAHIYVSKTDLQPLAYILYKYLQEATTITRLIAKLTQTDISIEAIMLTPESVRMTITAVITIPILIVYPMMQRYFVKGIMMGAIKG